jgi:hypothetical protein
MHFIENIQGGNINIENIANPGQTYRDGLDNAEKMEGTSIVGQIKTLFSPLFYLTNVFFIYFFFRINKYWCRFFILMISMKLVVGILSKGAQKDFFDLFIIFSSIKFLQIYFDKSFLKKYIKYSIIGLVLVVTLFITFQISRMEAYNQLDYTGTYRMTLDRSSFLFSFFGDRLGLGFSLLIMYLSQGYYGLSLTLQLPFEWTYGLGNSFALSGYASQYLDIKDILQDTYPFRMDQTFGWPATRFWHTFFPWVASDITFPGVIILMYFIGIIYATTIVESIKYSNPLSLTLFFFLNILIIYLPANNQLMQTREMTIGFIVILFVWVISHKRYNHV